MIKTYNICNHFFYFYFFIFTIYVIYSCFCPKPISCQPLQDNHCFHFNIIFDLSSSLLKKLKRIIFLYTWHLVTVKTSYIKAACHIYFDLLVFCHVKKKQRVHSKHVEAQNRPYCVFVHWRQVNDAGNITTIIVFYYLYFIVILFGNYKNRKYKELYKIIRKINFFWHVYFLQYICLIYPPVYF